MPRGGKKKVLPTPSRGVVRYRWRNPGSGFRNAPNGGRHSGVAAEAAAYSIGVFNAANAFQKAANRMAVAALQAAHERSGHHGSSAWPPSAQLLDEFVQDDVQSDLQADVEEEPAFSSTDVSVQLPVEDVGVAMSPDQMASPTAGDLEGALKELHELWTPSMQALFSPLPSLPSS